MKWFFISLLIASSSSICSAQIQIGSGTSTQSFAPINSYFGYNYSQQVYYASEIGQSGTISSISFFLASGNGTNSTSWTIYLGHTTLNTFSTTTGWITSSNLSEAFNGTVVFPSSGNWMTVNLTTPFVYNGTDNLIVAIDENTPGFTSSSLTSSWNYSATTNPTIIYYRNDSSNPSPSSPPTATGTSTYRPNIILGGISQPLCVAPIDQPTNPSFSSISSSSISGSFTAAASSPSGYLVVRSTSPNPPSPIDGTTYAAAATTLGSGTYVIQSSNASTFASSSLTSNTEYYFHVFSYNNSGCSGGPKYNTTNPLVANATTCLSGSPSTPTLSNETTTSFNASWTSFSGATSYRIDVSTNSTFTSCVSGYQDLTVNGTTATITGLSPNTTYYVRIRAHNGSCPSSNSSNASKTTFKTEPSNQVTNLAAGSVTTSAIPLSWTAATAGSQAPDGYLIKGSSTSLVAISDPVDGTDPGAGSLAFSVGTASFKTSSSPATFTGHSAGTMYYYKIFSFTNSGTAIDFKTDNVPTLNHATQPNTAGTVSFSASALNSSQATISWGAPSGYDATKHKILVFIKSGTTVISTTVLTANPTTFTANTTFTSGTAHTSDAAAYCIYNGDGTSVIVTGLSGNTTYQVRVVVAMMDVNSNGTYTYSSGSTTSGSTFKAEPSNQVTNLAAGSVTTSAIPLSWTAAVAGSQVPDGYLIKASAISLNSITDPADGTDPADITTFTSNSANKKQTTGSSTSSTSFSGMNAGTMYYYKVYSYTNSGTAIDFKTDNVPTLNHATLPSAATVATFANTSSSSTTLSWTQPSGYNSTNLSTLVFIKSGSAITAGTPTQGPSIYTANSTFYSGTSYQNDASAFCVYKGDGTSVTVSGLSSNTAYHFLILVVVDMSNSNSFNSYSSSLTANTTTGCSAVSSFSLDFEGISGLPQCTSFLSTDQFGANLSSNSSPYQGTQCLGMQTSGSVYIFPTIDNSHLNTHLIEFYARTFTGTGQIGFGYLTNALDANSYVNLATFNLTTTYQNCNYIPNGIPQNARIAIKLLSASVLRVDNISWNAIPTYTWSGSSSNDPSISSNWSTGALPTSNSNVIIPSNVPNYPTYTSLTIAQGNTFTLQSNAQLTISGTLTNNGTLTLESGATLVQGSSSTLAGSGTYNVKQAITGDGTTTPSGRFWYLGSPVSLASSSAYFASNAANVVKKRSESTNAWTALSSGSPEPLLVGQGYYTQAIPANSTINFTGGLLNNGAISITNLTRTAGQGFEGFNLVSNPYPSYLNWDVVSRTNVDGTMWYRTHDGTNMVFETYVAGAAGGVGTNLSGNTATKYIPPMQSYWVRVTQGQTSGSLALDNTMRTHFASLGSSTAGLRSTQDDPSLFLRMNLLQANKKDQLIVYVNEQATNGFDMLDGEKMMQAGYPQFYTKAGDKKIVINGLNSAKKQQALPVTIELPTTGVHSFVIEELEISNGLVWLEDKQEEIIQALEPGTVYQFYANAGMNAERFVLHFQLIDDAVPTIVYNEVNSSANFSGKGANVYAESAGVVVIKLPASAEGVTDIQIRDAAGKLVYAGSMNNLETSVELAQANGIYYVTLSSNTGVEVHKVFIQQ